jgi:purine-binding chemotaxis protein CheW
MESGCGSAAVSAPGMGVVTGVGKGVETKMAIASNRKDKTASFEEICSVRVGGTLFGVPIRHIYEIVGSTRPQPVPLAPGFVGGLVHCRGDVLTTVSLRYLLGLPVKEGAQDCLVIDGVGGSFGLLVDSLGEVLTVSQADHEPNPSTLDERRRRLLAGAYKLKDNLLVMLDPERLDPLHLGAEQAA